VAHGVARRFAFDCEVKLSAAAGGIACHGSAPRYSRSQRYGFGARSRIAVEARAADRAEVMYWLR
jgi:hypothetical protein